MDTTLVHVKDRRQYVAGGWDRSNRRQNWGGRDSPSRWESQEEEVPTINFYTDDSSSMHRRNADTHYQNTQCDSPEHHSMNLTLDALTESQRQVEVGRVFNRESSPRRDNRTLNHQYFKCITFTALQCIIAVNAIPQLTVASSRSWHEFKMQVAADNGLSHSQTFTNTHFHFLVTVKSATRFGGPKSIPVVFV